MPLKQVCALAGHAIATDLLRGKKNGKEAEKRMGQNNWIVKIRNKSEILGNGSTDSWVWFKYLKCSVYIRKGFTS